LLIGYSLRYEKPQSLSRIKMVLISSGIHQTNYSKLWRKTREGMNFTKRRRR